MAREYWLQTSEVLVEQETTKDGLHPMDAAERYTRYGPNKLEEGKKKSMPQRIWEQLRDPMILVLIAAGITSGIFGEIADMVIILVVVVLNAILGIYQEGKAEKAIEALQKMSAPHSKVRRGGNVCVIPSQEIPALHLDAIEWMLNDMQAEDNRYTIVAIEWQAPFYDGLSVSRSR